MADPIGRAAKRPDQHDAVHRLVPGHGLASPDSERPDGRPSEQLSEPVTACQQAVADCPLEPVSPADVESANVLARNA
jgi:hypothetical protein